MNLSWVILFAILIALVQCLEFTDDVILSYREKVRGMFNHAYDGYLKHAFPLDELKPLSCIGVDTWGSFSLSLVDALDTLIVIGNHTEFIRAVDLVLKSVKTDVNVNVSVFETNIRVVGGLLSAHMLSGQVKGYKLEEGWPCNGPLLRLAEQMASRLLPAFNTETGMPYGTVNLKYGVHREETPITCTASIGTFIVEFGTLSRLVGDPIYERVALKALDSLDKTKSSIGLLGNHINVVTGQWTATDAGIGAGVDSYFEYLVKGGLLFQRPMLLKTFYEHKKAIEKYIRKDDWFMWVNMFKGGVTFPIFQSLEAFWPGILTLIGDIEDARRIMLQYSKTIRSYGFPPEFYNIPEGHPTDKRAAFPLRPEMAESLMYLYRGTKDPIFLELGAQLVDAIEHSAKTKCGYGTVHDVREHDIEDRMESFFLAETTKYLYLLFDPDNFLHNDGSQSTVIDTPHGKCAIAAGGYIFNTEAHPVDPGIIECCSSKRIQEKDALKEWESGFDASSMVQPPEPTPDKTDDATRNVNKNVKQSTLPRTKPQRTFKKKNRRGKEALKKIREVIKVARLMDEEKQQKGEKTGVTRIFVDWLTKFYQEYEDVPYNAIEFDSLSLNKIKDRLLKRYYAEQIIVPQALSVTHCHPLDFIGESVNFRLMLSIIYKKHIYPSQKVDFLMSPICKLDEIPRIEDSYMNIPPPPIDDHIPGDIPDDIFLDYKSLPFNVNEENADPALDFELLLGPPQEFSSLFTGQHLVALRNPPKRKKKKN